MARLFTDIPAEILAIIEKRLDHNGLVSLSSTCSLFRQMLAPSVFKCIRFTNDESEAKEALKAVEKFADHVRELRFYGTFPSAENSYDGSGPEEGNDSDDSDEIDWRPAEKDKQLIAKIVPPSTWVLLKHNGPKNPLESLDTVTISFQPDDPQTWPHSTWNYFYEEMTEENYAPSLQALMSQTWILVSTNSKIKHLKIRELPPLHASFWDSENFGNWFRHLDSLELSLWGSSNGAGWEANTAQKYCDFVDNLRYIFVYLESLTSFKLESSPRNGPLGLQGLNYMPLPLEPHFMPELRRLELFQCFASPEFVDFLGSHSKTLETLILRECYAEACQMRLAHNSIWWSDLFEAVIASRPVLSDFQIVDQKVPLTDEEEWKHDYDPENFNEDDEVKEIREVLKDPQSGRRLLGYAYLDDKYGMFFLDEEINVERFKEGSDQRTYDELMKIVNGNALKKRRH